MSRSRLTLLGLWLACLVFAGCSAEPVAGAAGDGASVDPGAAAALVSVSYASAEHCGLLHEHDFGRDDTLRASPCHIVGVYLEHPSDEAHEHDSGEAGVDRIPYQLAQEEVFRLCLHDDDGEAHWALMEDDSGAEVFRIDADGPCFDDVLPAGDYVLRMHHGASDEHPFAERFMIAPHLGYEPTQQVAKADAAYAVHCDPGDDGATCDYDVDEASCGCESVTSVRVQYHLDNDNYDIDYLDVPVTLTWDGDTKTCMSGEVSIESDPWSYPSYDETLPAFQVTCPSACPCQLAGLGTPKVRPIVLTAASASSDCSSMNGCDDSDDLQTKSPADRGWPTVQPMACAASDGSDSPPAACPAPLTAVRIQANGCKGCNLSGVDFVGASDPPALDWLTFFVGTDLSHADFRGSNIEYMSFDYAKLDGTRFYDEQADTFPDMHCTTFQNVDLREVAGWPDLASATSSTAQAFLRSLLPSRIDRDDPDAVEPYLRPDGGSCKLYIASDCKEDGWDDDVKARWTCQTSRYAMTSDVQEEIASCEYRGCRTSFAFSTLGETALPSPTTPYTGTGSDGTDFTLSPKTSPAGAHASYWRLLNLNGTTYGDGSTTFPTSDSAESWEDIDLSGARVAGMTMAPERSLRGTVWTSAQIGGASFEGTDLEGAVLDRAMFSSDQPSWSCVAADGVDVANYQADQAYGPTSQWNVIPLIECPGYWELLEDRRRKAGDSSFVFTIGSASRQYTSSWGSAHGSVGGGNVMEDAWQEFVQKMRTDRRTHFMDLVDDLTDTTDFGGPTNLRDTTWRGTALRDHYSDASGEVETFSRVSFGKTSKGSPALDGADFGFANISGVDFAHASFANVKLSHTLAAIGADFSRVENTLDPTSGNTTLALQQAALSMASFNGLDLTGADFRGANLTGTTFVGATLDQATFGGTPAHSSAAAPAGCSGDCPASTGEVNVYAFSYPDDAIGAYAVNFDGASLKAASFKSVVLQYAESDGTDHKAANFNNAWLDGADFSGAQIDGATFDSAIARKMTLSFQSTALPQGVDFGHALLTGSSFADSGCNGCTFSNTLLIDVDFSGADLSGSKLDSSFLAGADLSSADLQGADLTYALVITPENAGQYQYWNYSKDPGDDGDGGRLDKIDAALTKATSEPSTGHKTRCPDGDTHSGGCGALDHEAWAVPDEHVTSMVSEYEDTCAGGACVNADISNAKPPAGQSGPPGKGPGEACASSSECISSVCIPPLKRCK